jgi:tRNA pseudouridine65 synthase
VHEAAAALARHGVSLAGGVHFVSRLDRGASGVLTACLSPAAAAALQAVWADAAVVSKEYLVLVAGCAQLHKSAKSQSPDSSDFRHPQEDTWRDTRPLTARELGGGRRRRSSAPQEAVTDFSVLARFPAAPPALPFATALLSASPRTGRWHQIRRHLSGCGRHVLGDVSHGKLRYNGPARHALGLHRLFLHAAELRVAAAGMPGGGEAMRCVAPLPRELADAAARLPGWEQAAGKALRARGLLLPQDADGPGADDQAPS